MRYLLTLFAFALLATTAHAQVVITEGYSFHPEEAVPYVEGKSYCRMAAYHFTVNEPYAEKDGRFYFYLTWEGYDSTLRETIHLKYYKKSDKRWSTLCRTPEYTQFLTAHFTYNDCIDGVITWRLNIVDTLGNAHASLWRECSGKIRATCNGVAVNLEGIEQMGESQEIASNTVDEKPVEKVQEEPQEKLPIQTDQVLQPKHSVGKIE